jgi:hypothetical protein
METLRAAISRTVAFLPDLVAGVIILVVGWIIAAVVRRVIVAALPRLGFDRFLARHNLAGERVEEHRGSRTLGTIAYWVILLIALMQAAAVWNLPYVANGIARVLAYIPNAIIAVVIFGAAYVAGNLAARRLRESRNEQQAQSKILPGAVRAGILTIGAFLALRELNIAPEILVIAFTLVFGAIAIATALAFGLGGRRTAEKVTDDWYEDQRARRAQAPARSGVVTHEVISAPDLH